MSDGIHAAGDRVRSASAQLAAAGERLVARPDGPLAAALLLGLVAMLEVRIGNSADPGVASFANLVATLPIVLVRRSLPAAAALIVVGVVIVLAESNAKLTVAALVALVSVSFLVAARYQRRWSVALAAPFALNAIEPFSGHASGLAAVLLLIVVVAALALGDAHRQRGAALAERDEAQRDQALMEERARIARELHDVVAHHVSMIAVQAETARLTTPDLPEEGKQRFADIGTTARESLTEMRRLLGVLREDAGGDAERAPQPGLDGIEALLDAAREAGTTVRLTVSGTAQPLAPAVDLTAYRVVQEALTNARRHAPGAEVDVELRYEAERLLVEVRDDGPGAPDAEAGEGHGLIGMRERVAMAGGTLEVGPRADSGGFALRAELPTGAAVA